MNQNQPTTKKKKKGCLIVTLIVISLIFIIAIGSIFSSKDTTNQTTNQSTDQTDQTDQTEPQKKLTYKDVFVFKGNGKKKSEAFHLTGNDAKLVYKYSSGISQGGVFNVSVIKKGDDVAVEGEMPEILITSSKEESEGTIQKPEGDYYLDVDAMGNWEITVQEKQ